MRDTDAVKYVVDATSGTVVVATLTNILPPIAASLAMVWTIIRIYETDTVQKLLKKK